jgi:3-(3-hydroxy-phenyl)propionate hydroxylase
VAHYDVAVVGYGPTGVTAANLLGAAGLTVLVVERDAEVYARARAISTDEEVLRIWQSVGLADELARDMISDCPISLVDHAGRSFFDATFTPRGHGHSPQLFFYQPALESTLRQGVKRFPNVDVLLDVWRSAPRPRSGPVPAGR